MVTLAAPLYLCLRRFPWQLPRAGRILDVGSGTGPAALPAAAEVGPAGLVVALDPAPAMLRRLGLRRITIPMLVMRGSRDPIVTRAAMAELEREAGNAQMLEVQGAAHALHVSHPHVVSRAIQAYARLRFVG